MATTFGAYISQERKKLGLSQKELAQKIKREEDGEAISPQYLNDIEKDRRRPTSDHMMQQFASVLGLLPNYLFYLSGTLPSDVDKDKAPEEVDQLIKAFRKS